MYIGQPLSSWTLIFLLGPGYKKRQRATLSFSIGVMPHSFRLMILCECERLKLS